MLPDLRFALRMLRRNPGFAAISVAALALGIGATTAIFTLINAALLRPPEGIAAPERLVTFERWQAGQLLGTMSYPDFADYRTRLQSFAGLAVEARASVSFTGGSLVEPVPASLVSDDYFTTLGVVPAAGRLLDISDSHAPLAVLSHSLCLRTFGADSAAPGRSVTINGHAFTIAGVTPAGFRGTVPQWPTDLWLPIALQPIAMPRLSPGALENRASGWIRIFGRLKPAAPIAAAQAEVRTAAAQLAREYPITNQSRTITLVPGVGLWSDDRAALRRFLLLLLLSVALLQCIACANVTSLLLARTALRTREIAVRLALGATRARLARLLIIEALVLWSIAGAAALWVAPMIARAAAAMRQPAYAMRALDVHPDFRVTLFGLLLTLISGLLFSSIPAWRAARVNLGTRAATPQTRGSLIAAQVALSVVLVSGAGTVLRTVERALASNPIVHPEQVLLASFDLSIQGYTPEQAAQFYDSLLERTRNLPGVTSASLGASIPPQELSSRIAIFQPGKEPPQEILQGRGLELGTWVDMNRVAPDFFRTLGIPLVAGREFTRLESSPVALVNQRLAAHLWPHQNPIGQRIAAPEWSGPPRPPVQIVGVVRDVASRSLLASPSFQIYLPLAQSSELRAALALRTLAAPPGVAASLRDAVRRIDPRVPLLSVETMPQHLDVNLWRQRLASSLLAIFGLLSTALVMIGVYGVAAHAIAQRTREIGIRMAIGARAGQIRAMALRTALQWIAAGFAAGAPAAVLTTLLVRKAIPGVQPFEPAALAATLLLLIATGLLAAYFPARRASRIDPLPALRCE